jgi:hypothetical protein
MISDLAKGPGRFNFLQRLLALATWMGASLNNLINTIKAEFEGSGIYQDSNPYQGLFK